MIYLSLSALDLVKRKCGCETVCLRSIGGGRVKKLAKHIFFWGPVGAAIVWAVRAKDTSSSTACGDTRGQESWQWCGPVDE